MEDIKDKCIASMRRVSTFETANTYSLRLALRIVQYYTYKERAPLSVIDEQKRLRVQQEGMMDGKQGRLFA